jgi:hypothetical protein
MTRTILALAFITCAVPATTTAQLPVGYTETSPTSLPDSLREVLNGGRFVISLSRSAATPQERRLIERAESIFPPGGVIDVASRKGMGQTEVTTYYHGNIPGPRWWLREWHGVLIPYALTGTAARYYIDRLRAFATGPNPFEHYEPGFEHRSSAQPLHGPRAGAQEERLIGKPPNGLAHRCVYMSARILRQEWSTSRKRIVIGAHDDGT